MRTMRKPYAVIRRSKLAGIRSTGKRWIAIPNFIFAMAISSLAILFLVISSLATLFLALSAPLSAQISAEEAGIPGEALAGFNTISQNDIRTIIEFLASDELEGREAEARGGTLSSMYISSWLSASEVPAWRGALQAAAQISENQASRKRSASFFQEIPCLTADVDISSSHLSLEKMSHPAADIVFTLEEDVFLSPQSAESFSITAPAVFAGYGIEASEYGYSDYAGSNVKGKIVIVFNHEPQEKDEKSIFRGAKSTRYSMPGVKAQIAREKGAAALIIMRDRNNAHKSMRDTLSQRGTKEERGHFLGLEESPSIPIFYIEDSVADEFFEGTGVDLKKAQAAIDQTLKSQPVPIDRPTMTFKVVMKNKKKVVLNNVVARIEGSDIRLRDEGVIVGAHYDHLGMKPEGIYHGADDNASGVAALLSLARAFTRNPVKPKRSIYFVSFAAEERGVIGSKYFSTHLPLPKEKISVMINLDELGRNNSDKQENANMAIAFSSGQSPELKGIIKNSNGFIGLEIKQSPTLKFLTNSDHSLFHELEIPVIFFFSGFHDDYHKPTDTADKINYPKVEKMTRLVYLTIWDIANRDKRVVFDRSITVEPVKDEFDKPY